MRSPPCTTWSTTDGLMLMVMKMLVLGSDSDDDGEDHLVRNASSETGEN